MIGKEIPRGPKRSLQECVGKSKTCVNHTDYIDKNYPEIAKSKKDIVVGFGFVSHNYGLSTGVPIDIYTMLLTAEKIRREVLAEGAKVHILIGDHFAFACQHESCKNAADVAKKRAKYIKKLQHILQNMGIANHYVFHLSSAIVADPNYRVIRENLEIQAAKVSAFKCDEDDPKKRESADGKHSVSIDTWELLNPGNSHKYEQTNRNYFLDQTALLKFLYDWFGCAIKVSWTKAHQTSKINQSRSFDEPHFDRFYRELYFDMVEKLSFVYTKPGFAINRTDEHAKAIPYTAPQNNEVQRILLSSKQPIPTDVTSVNPDFTRGLAINAKLLKELKSEVEYGVVENETDIDAFYKNVNILRQFGRNPSKNLCIKFKERLQLQPKEAATSSTLRGKND